jgi:DNA-binding FrmR family transcriptional regulator
MIHILEKMSKKDRTVEIKLSPRLKVLWNRMKRYQGQLKGMKNLKLAQRRKQKEDALQQFINADPKLREKYGNLLEQLKNHYDEKRKDAGYDLLLDNFLKSSTLLNNAYKVYEASIEREKEDTERESDYMDRNIDRTRQRMKQDLRNYYEPVDKIFLKDMFLRAIKLKEKGYPSIPAMEEIIKNTDDAEKAIDAFIETAYQLSKLNDESYMMDLLKKTTRELDQVEDPFIQMARALYPAYKSRKDKEKRQKGLLDQLLSQLIDVKKEFAGKDFIPDANSTLRLTYGRIRGYSPADAVIHTPFTTLGGVVEKHTGEEPFIAPKKLIDLYKAKDFGQFVHPGLKDVPVAMLYNTDTTGGNSGSPVLNAQGQLVGLNFDRIFEATINDYAWDESYSRSIGVDVRYILWFLDKFGSAHHLLKEMKVQ